MSFQHAHIWAAIDEIAAGHGLTPSALARMSGLDATAFNLSKRRNTSGRARWPSTESIARVLTAVEMGFEEFAAVVVRHGRDGL
jgi:phage repressor protein C with HTH and peptisase S24 domain